MPYLRNPVCFSFTFLEQFYSILIIDFHRISTMQYLLFQAGGANIPIGGKTLSV